MIEIDIWKSGKLVKTRHFLSLASADGYLFRIIADKNFTFAIRETV